MFEINSLIDTYSQSSHLFLYIDVVVVSSIVVVVSSEEVVVSWIVVVEESWTVTSEESWITIVSLSAPPQLRNSRKHNKDAFFILY